MYIYIILLSLHNIIYIIYISLSWARMARPSGTAVAQPLSLSHTHTPGGVPVPPRPTAPRFSRSRRLLPPAAR